MKKKKMMKELVIKRSSLGDLDPLDPESSQHVDIIALDRIRNFCQAGRKQFKRTAWTHLFPPLLAKYDRIRSFGVSDAVILKEFTKKSHGPVLVRSSKQQHQVIGKLVKFMRTRSGKYDPGRHFGPEQILRFSMVLDTIDFGAQAVLGSRSFERNMRGDGEMVDCWYVKSEPDVMRAGAKEVRGLIDYFVNSERKRGRPSSARNICEALFVPPTLKTFFDLIVDWTYIAELKMVENKHVLAAFVATEIPVIRHRFDEFQKNYVLEKNRRAKSRILPPTRLSMP